MSKSTAAVELGRRGGLKGGRVRAERMTPEQRSDAARHAARARWRNINDDEEAIEMVRELIGEGFKPEEIFANATDDEHAINKEMAVLREDRCSAVYIKEAVQLYYRSESQR